MSNSTNSIEKRMLGSVISAADRQFIDDMRHSAACGVGYGFMQQVIEWEWQDKDEMGGVGTWGPEHFNAEIKRLTVALEESQEAVMLWQVEAEKLQKQIDSLQQKVHLCAGYDKLTDELEQLQRRYDLLAGAVNDDGDHCDDDCDSMAHSDACNQAGTGLVLRMQDRIVQLEAALKVYEGIVSESHGVAGWHLNGDIAEWGEFDLPQIAGVSLLHPDCRGPWERGQTSYPKEEHARDCDKCQQWRGSVGDHGND